MAIILEKQMFSPQFLWHIIYNLPGAIVRQMKGIVYFLFQIFNAYKIGVNVSLNYKSIPLQFTFEKVFLLAIPES